MLTSVLPAQEARCWHPLNAAASFVTVTVVFGAIYKVVPQVPIKWRDVILGAAVTAVLFALGNLLLGLVLGEGVLIVHLWRGVVYRGAYHLDLLPSQIFFLGAEFTKAFACIYGSAPTRKASVRLPGTCLLAGSIADMGY